MTMIDATPDWVATSTVTLEALPPARDEPHHDLTDADRYAQVRVVPVLVVGGEVVLGTAAVTRRHDGRVELRIVVCDLWRLSDDRYEAVDVASCSDDDRHRVADTCRGWLADTVAPYVAGEDESGIDAVAKEICNGSRNQLAGLRTHRYQSERRLIDTISGSGMRRWDDVLAGLIEFSVLVGRCRDVFRERARSGLTAWKTESSLYHAQRSLIDPSLPERPGRAEARALPWFAIYDAAIRQCLNAERQLHDEVLATHQILAAASTVAATREAQSAELLSSVATVGGVAVGLSALVIASYSITTVLPFELNLRTLKLFIPLAVASVFAAATAYATSTRSARRRRAFWAFGATVLLGALIALAGTLYTRA